MRDIRVGIFALLLCSVNMFGRAEGMAVAAPIACPFACAVIVTGGITAVEAALIATGIGAPVAAAIGAALAGAGAGGLSVAGCTTVCLAAAIPASCFDGRASTDVILHDGSFKQVNIQSLKPGMYVRSMDEKSPSAPTVSRIESVLKISGYFEFFQFEFEDGAAINVTAPHVMILCSGNKDLKATPAHDVAKGDSMLVRNAHRGQTTAQCVKIKRATSFYGSEKINVETNTGTIIVNNIFTTGICEKNDHSIKDVNQLLDEYRFTHGYEVIKTF